MGFGKRLRLLYRSLRKGIRGVANPRRRWLPGSRLDRKRAAARLAGMRKGLLA